MKTLIENIRYFDGSPNKSFIANILLTDGRIASVSKAPIGGTFDKVIDGTNLWLMPGFIDSHTHYDAEVLASPGLKESVRHGVTTNILGCCSISIVYSEVEDCSDIYTRVEAIPREHVLPLLQERKNWNNPKDYISYLETLNLGSNISSFIGHSDIRISTLGLKNAVDKSYRPSKKELTSMQKKLEAALKAGMLGMSMMTTKWDKLDGDRFRSKALPSTYARMSEFSLLSQVLRQYNRVLQGAPDIVTKINMFYFLSNSIGIFRKKLKTTLITLADTKSNPLLYRLVMLATDFFNKILRADFRWQALPCPFQVYADGMDLVVFEEFGAGEEALHIKDQLERKELLKDPAYRQRFIKDYSKKFSARVWHRDFGDSQILSCPNQDYVGQSFGDIALAQNLHPVDAFLNCVIDYGTALRWTTVIANHRKKALQKIISHSGTIISFSDAGAHLRNMAFYNFPIQMLKLVNDALKENKPFMTLEKAVWKLTGELGDWLGLEAGYIREGDRADLVVIDPQGLNASVLEITERPFVEFGNIERMVNNSDSAVHSVYINGEEVFSNNQFSENFGKEKNWQVLEGDRMNAVIFLFTLILSFNLFAIDINKVSMKSTHNSYQRDEGVIDQLLFHNVRSLEFDLHTKKWLAPAPPGDWYVYHYFLELSSNVKFFSSVLEQLNAFNREFPEHDPLFIFVDLKNYSTTHSPQAFDNFISLYIDRKSQFQPADLMALCPSASKLSESIVPPCKWPEVSQLKGKIIFVITQGKLDHYRQSNKGRLAFVASKKKDFIEDTIFFNGSFRQLDWMRERQAEGFLTRVYGLNKKERFDKAQTTGVNFLATNKVNFIHDAWSSTHTEGGNNYVCHGPCEAKADIQPVVDVTLKTGKLKDDKDNIVFFSKLSNRALNNQWEVIVSASSSHQSEKAQACLTGRESIYKTGSDFFSICRTADKTGIRVVFREDGKILRRKLVVSNPFVTIESYSFLKLTFTQDDFCANGFGSDDGKNWIKVASHCFKQRLRFQGISANSKDFNRPARFKFFNLKLNKQIQSYKKTDMFLIGKTSIIKVLGLD